MMLKQKTISADELIKIIKHSSAENDLVKILTDSGLSSILLFSTTQQARLKKLINWLKENYCKKNSSNYSAFFGSDLNNKQIMGNFTSLVTNYSLFSQSSIVIIYDIEQIKAASHKQFIEALNKNTSNLIIICAQEETTKTSIVNKFIDICSMVAISELKGPDLSKWIEREFFKINSSMKIDSGVIPYLQNNFGQDVTRLLNEIEKICLLSAQSNNVSLDLVQDVVASSKESTSFELVLQIASKNPAAALKISKALLDQGLHPLQISSFLSKAFRIIAANKESSVKDPTTKELSNFWFVRQLSSSFRGFSVKDLKASIDVLKKLDFQLKDSGLEHQISLLNSVQQIATRSF